MDDGLWILLALAGVAFMFLGPIGFFLTIGARRRLEVAERKIRALEARLPAVQWPADRGTRYAKGEAPSAGNRRHQALGWVGGREGKR